MSQIADDLKQQIDIMDVIGRYVDLKRAGSNYTGLCPFHREKSPSFMVSRDRQTYKCFGCGLGGDVISFVMEYEKMDFWDAIKELATRYHFDLTPYKSEKSSIDSYIDTKDQREKLKLINKLTAKRFHEQLAKHSDASDYIHDRRHLDDDVIARRQIGYAPSNGQLLNQYLQSKGFTIEDLTQAGLVRQSQSNADTYSFFRHRMMFPISDHVGNIVGFGGRIINPEDTAKSKDFAADKLTPTEGKTQNSSQFSGNPKYLNTGDTELYRKSNILYGLHQAKSHIKTHDQVIVVEGYMDVIALDRLGMPVGVAPCGTSLTLDHIKLLTRYTQDIVLMFDNDNAGQTAGIRSVKLLLEQGIYPKLLRLSSPYKDIDDLANSDLGDDEKQSILTSTVDWFDALVAQLQIAYPLDHPVAIKQLINEMFAVLTSIGDFSVFMGYLNKLAKLVGMDENGLLNQYKQRHRTTKAKARSNSESPRGGNSQLANSQPSYEEDVDLLLVSIAQLPIYNLHPPGESTLMSIKGDQGGIFVQLHKLALDLQTLKGNPEYTPSQLEEGVLRRSRTIDQMTSDKQLTELQQFISRYIQANTQLIIKSSSLTLDEKQVYLTRIKRIK